MEDELVYKIDISRAERRTDEDVGIAADRTSSIPLDTWNRSNSEESGREMLLE